jgi:hypothetical protein
VLTRVEVRAPEPKPERIRLQNVTLVPAKGARVLVADRISASPSSAEKAAPAHA